VKTVQFQAVKSDFYKEILMNSRSIYSLVFTGILSISIPTQANASIIVADTAIAFFDSGAGPMPGPYGGTYPGTYPVAVPLSYALDGDSTTFVSLPTGSYMTVGFSTGYVFDGAGLDLFVSEVGGSDELASVYVSSDFGGSFTFLGTATTATVSGFDLASIGYTGHVNAVKIVGLDNFGGSPGFDLAFVQGLEGSSIVSDVPEPGTLALLSLGLVGLFGATGRRQ
jgi:hypothetical protein